MTKDSTESIFISVNCHSQLHFTYLCAMLIYLKKAYVQFIIFWILLLLIITFLIPSPLNKVSREEDEGKVPREEDEDTSSNYVRETHITNLESVALVKQQLLDISNFTFIIRPNQSICDKTFANGTTIKAVFIVTSHANSVETRSAMRRAFSTDNLITLKVRRVFLLGVTPDNKYINQKSIEDEARRYNDIVQGSFSEAYRNLTYKHVMGLKWVSEYCSKTQFVIKMDDDIIVNMLKLITLLGKWKTEEEFIAGYILKGLKAKRLKANKWFVTKEEYPLLTYPPFASGWLYITTPTVCRKLLKLSETKKYFWIDDVFVTGILAEKIGIKKYDIREYFTDHPEYFQCCLNDLSKYKFDCDIVVGPNGGRTNLFFEFNEAFAKCAEHRCFNRSFPMNESCVGSKTLNLGRGNAVISTYNLV